MSEQLDRLAQVVLKRRGVRDCRSSRRNPAPRASSPTRCQRRRSRAQTCRAILDEAATEALMFLRAACVE